ncbi:MAG TPA: S26 family signal peptidase [Candidatus Saccharimonadales bacterium]
MRLPLTLRRVVGQSMWPTLASEQILIISRWTKPQLGSVVVARVGGREYVKRVVSIEDGDYILLGDNYFHSVDSREFGAVGPAQIVGVALGQPRTFSTYYRAAGQAG